MIGKSKKHNRQPTARDSHGPVRARVHTYCAVSSGPKGRDESEVFYFTRPPTNRAKHNGAKTHTHTHTGAEGMAVNAPDTQHWPLQVASAPIGGDFAPRPRRASIHIQRFSTVGLSLAAGPCC
jgi:hypothetical protein